MPKPRVKSIHDRTYQVFVEYLREARTNAGLTQTELASRLHTDQSYVSKYERAERRLDVVELRVLCHQFNISLPEFIRGLEEELDRRGLS